MTSFADAGLIAYNVNHPAAAPGDPVRVQGASGIFQNAKITYLLGRVVVVAPTMTALLAICLPWYAPVDWVALGGVLIRRE